MKGIVAVFTTRCGNSNKRRCKNYAIFCHTMYNVQVRDTF